MINQKKIKQFLSRFDPFKIQIGVYFRSEPIYHSKFSIIFSIILLAVCLYLPLIVSQTPYLNTIIYDKNKAQFIPFRPRFKIHLEQQQWNVQLKCITKRNNEYFNQSIDLMKTVNSQYQVLEENIVFCNLKQSEQQDSSLQLIIKCSNCSNSTDIQTKIKIQNYYTSSQDNNLRALNKDFTFKYSSQKNLIYTIPVYNQIYKTYQNWFLGSFDMFPKEFYSFFIKDIKVKTFQNIISQGCVVIQFIHSGQTLFTEKYYPSGLNYGLSVLAIYGIFKFIFKISFLDRFQKRQLCIQRGYLQKQVLSLINIFLTSLFPDFIVNYFKSYLNLEIQAMNRGKKLMNIDNLLKTSRKIAHDREPLMKAYININKDDQSEIDQQIYVNNIQTNNQLYKQRQKYQKKTTYLNINNESESNQDVRNVQESFN